MSYDLQTLDLPRLSGTALRLLAAALENPLTGPALRRKLLRDAGLADLATATPEAPPTPHPLAAAPPSPTQAAAGGAADLIAALLERPAPATPGFQFATVRDYAAAYRAGRTTPKAVAQALLTALRAADEAHPPLKAFIQHRPDDLLAEAEAATQRFRAGTPRSLFDGVPVAIKDELHVRGYGTTLGTRFLGRLPEPRDATTVACFRGAGALILGKTNMHEIGIGVTGLNAHHGTPRNPYDPTRHTGGSSSGSAAAVAAGLCPVALGADGGGSIRIPAALCGVVGLKATYGRISTIGAMPLDWSVGHVGPIGATADDVALAYALLAGADPADVLSQHQPAPTLAATAAQRSLKGLRLGLYTPWFEDATPDVVGACRRLVNELVAAGATVHEVTLPELEALRHAHVVTISSEMRAALARYHKNHRRDYSYDVRVNLALAEAFTAVDYVQAQRIRTRALRHFAAAFADVDLLLTPATGRTAPPIPEATLPEGSSDLPLAMALMRFATPANMTGLPAVVVPAGYDADGLPVGLQAMAPHWQEDRLLQFAYAAAGLVARRRPVRYAAPEAVQQPTLAATTDGA